MIIVKEDACHDTIHYHDDQNGTHWHLIYAEGHNLQHGMLKIPPDPFSDEELESARRRPGELDSSKFLMTYTRKRNHEYVPKYCPSLVDAQANM